MNYKMVVYLLGRIFIIMALLMCVPMVIAFARAENASTAFLIAVLVQFILGSLCCFKRPKNAEIFAKEGLVTVALCWIFTSLFGCLPFFLSGEIPSLIDAWFETVSGFTTTGSSILNNIECLSKSLLFWRSFTHWIGGMGVLVFVLAILPKTHTSQSMYIMRAEAPGPQVGKLVSRMRSTAQILYGIYIALTIIQIFCLKLTGMPWFDSVVNSFATAGTGGFAIKNASIAAYNSAAVDWIISIFMILFGINFTLFYLILTGNIVQALKSEELHWYLGIIATSAIVIALNILPQYENLWQALRYSVFQVTSLISTTGFITADYEKWPMLSQIILMGLVFTGACAGSTGGGLKVSRILILIKSSIRELRMQLRPRSVNVIRLEGKQLDTTVISSVMAYMCIYVFVFMISMFIVSLDNCSFASTFTAVATCLNNVGPGLEAVGPAHNFSTLSTLSKLVLSVDMLAGRLELIPIVVLFAPNTWKRR